MKLPNEAAEQLTIRRLFGGAGLWTATTSQYRASHVTEGLPDLWVVGYSLAFWFESKAPATGELAHPFLWAPKPLRPKQELFRRRCLQAGMLYAWGTRREAALLLEEHGLLEILSYRDGWQVRYTERARFGVQALHSLERTWLTEQATALLAARVGKGRRTRSRG